MIFDPLSLNLPGWMVGTIMFCGFMFIAALASIGLIAILLAMFVEVDVKWWTK